LYRATRRPVQLGNRHRSVTRDGGQPDSGVSRPAPVAAYGPTRLSLGSAATPWGRIWPPPLSVKQATPRRARRAKDSPHPKSWLAPLGHGRGPQARCCSDVRSLRCSSGRDIPVPSSAPVAHGIPLTRAEGEVEAVHGYGGVRRPGIALADAAHRPGLVPTGFAQMVEIPLIVGLALVVPALAANWIGCPQPRLQNCSARGRPRDSRGEDH
jgi:hypothetical protein